MPMYFYGTISTLYPNPIPIPGIITNISVSGSGTFQTGTATTDGITYSVYAFTSSTTTPATPLNTVTYTSNSTTQIFVLAVAGGGSGSSSAGGGGGAGGVVMTPVTLKSGTNTISIGVGSGGAASAINSRGNNGYNTIITFSDVSASITTITALGGGYGAGASSAVAASNGGSGGGNDSTNKGAGNALFTGLNFGCPGGGTSGAPTYTQGGGGGAGTAGVIGKGGNGIQCFLPGIKDYNITSAKYPSGTPVSGLYWGGGGGGSATGASQIITGGLGGGGGGGASINVPAPYPTSTGGGSALNDVSNGTIETNPSPGVYTGGGGSGAINTGGGGGASWNSVSGAGGSGIVIIAFPSGTTAVFGNTYSVLTNTSFSSAAYNSVRGAYGCRLLNYNYYGPIFTLRYSTDTNGVSTQNFYTDTTGTLIGNAYLGTGQSLSSWLSSKSGAATGFAYVTKWYDQGMDNSFNSATQYDTTRQPIYQLKYNVINTGYTGSGTAGTDYPSGWTTNAGNAWFNLPDGCFPTGDDSYTITFKHYNFSPSLSVFCSFGLPSTNKNVNIQYYTTGSNGYKTGFNNNDQYIGTTNGPYVGNNYITSSYIKGSNGNRNMYYNGVSKSLTSSGTIASRTGDPTQNVIGALGTSNVYFSNVQYYYLYTFDISLNTTDRTIVEAT